MGAHARISESSIRRFWEVWIYAARYPYCWLSSLSSRQTTTVTSYYFGRMMSAEMTLVWLIISKALKKSIVMVNVLFFCNCWEIRRQWWWVGQEGYQLHTWKYLSRFQKHFELLLWEKDSIVFVYFVGWILYSCDRFVCWVQVCLALCGMCRVRRKSKGFFRTGTHPCCRRKVTLGKQKIHPLTSERVLLCLFWSCEDAVFFLMKKLPRWRMMGRMLELKIARVRHSESIAMWDEASVRSGNDGFPLYNAR